jgi:hypothetical protein
MTRASMMGCCIIKLTAEIVAGLHGLPGLRPPKDYWDNLIVGRFGPQADQVRQ